MNLELLLLHYMKLTPWVIHFKPAEEKKNEK